MKKNTGFTLTELMVTLVIVGILVVAGGPMLTSTLQGGQLVASTNELVSAIHISRSEAVKLNRKVTICVSNDGVKCLDSKKWQEGWIVFVDSNGDRIGTGTACSSVADIASDCLLRAHGKIDDDLLSITGIHDSNSTDIKWLTFTSRGQPKDGSATRSGIFSVCSFDKGSSAVNSRAVVLSLPGRVRISDNATTTCPAAP